MKIRFVSDTHLGLSRQSHTTPESAKRLQQALFDAAMGAAVPQSDTVTIHAADLFDKYDNPAWVVMQGFHVASRCDYLLAGNHDCSNRADTTSSLDLVTRWGRKALTVIDRSNGFNLDGLLLCMVPHQMTQTDFESELMRIAKMAEGSLADLNNLTALKVLVAHCNYDNPLTEKSESSLNLTREKAEELLKSFDFIFLGHEHNPRTDFDGRLVVLGSLMPTSFGDVSDKYQWELDTETRKLSVKLAWETHNGCLRIDWRTLDFASQEVPYQFIDVVGTATPSQVPEVAKAIHDLWANGPNLLMVRNSVKVEGKEAVAVSEAHKHVNVVDRVREELKGTEMGVRFEGYVND